MRGRPSAAAILLCHLAAALAQTPGDARRGREIFRSAGCLQCHERSFDSGAFFRARPEYLTARAGLAAAMWKHAPLLRRESLTVPVTEREAADLFSYLYANAMAARARRTNHARAVLASKRCARCHSPSARDLPPPASFSALARIAWNHAARASPARPRLPKLTEADAWKLIGWVVAGPGQGRWIDYHPLEPEEGRRVYERKGCTGCHRYPPANRFPARSPARFLAALWNHASYGARGPSLSDEELRRLLGYFWAIHYFDERGDAAVGRSLFHKKHCAGCHEDLAGGAPRLGGGKRRSGMWLIARLGEHGPVMYERVREAGFAWPRLSPLEAADILAYVNSLKSLRLRRPPAPVR